jgi:hypothetical protein
MKTLMLLLVSVVGTVGFLRWRQANIARAEEEQARAESEAVVQQMGAAGYTPVLPTGPRAETPGDGSRVVTRLPSGKLVEHDRRVTGTQSTGMGGFTRAAPTPEPRTMLDRKAYR